MSYVTPNTSKFAVTSYFDCKTVEDFEAYPKVCITAEVAIEKAKVHHVNTDEIKAAIEKAVRTSVWLYSPTAGRAGSAKTAEPKGSTSTGNPEE